MLIAVGLALTGLAAVLHVYIFWMESLAWTKPATRKVFGTTAEQAEQTRELAFNQGFYNLFLAIAIGVGIVLYVLDCGDSGDCRVVGTTLVFTGAGSMVAAGVVLLLSSPDKASAALKQLVIPLLGIVALAVGLLI